MGRIATRRAVERRSPRERLLLERELRVQVDLRRGDLLVAEPEGDDGGIDAGVQQPHRCGVPAREESVAYSERIMPTSRARSPPPARGSSTVSA